MALSLLTWGGSTILEGLGAGRFIRICQTSMRILYTLGIIQLRIRVARALATPMLQPTASRIGCLPTGVGAPILSGVATTAAIVRHFSRTCQTAAMLPTVRGINMTLRTKTIRSSAVRTERSIISPPSLGTLCSLTFNTTHTRTFSPALWTGMAIRSQQAGPV